MTFTSLRLLVWLHLMSAAAVLWPASSLQAQQTQVYQDTYQQYLQARQWFSEEKYALAYPVFQQMHKAVQQSAHKPLFAEELKYYLLACELINGQAPAVDQANNFLADNNSQPLQGQLAFHLGNFHFQRSQYAEAAEAYAKVDATYLGNEAIATKEFRQGYSLFTQKQFAPAKGYFQSVRQSPDLPYYTDANYYYGLLAFQDMQYQEAIKSFEIARANPRYQPLVPYYTASINYAVGNKAKGMEQAEQSLKNGNTLFRAELMQLLGHGYFEQKDYTKARQYLEQFVASSSKVRREDLYELAYCYYNDKQYAKAIEQFKPLSSGSDSLSHHAMYLLGDAYLKTNDKANARNAFLFCSTNSSTPAFQETGLFNYGKLSFELGFDNDALQALKQYVTTYPAGANQAEARDLLVGALARTSNYKEALELYETIPNKSEFTRKLYPQIAFNRAQELINDRKIVEGEKLLDAVLASPYPEGVAPLAQFWKGEIAYQRDQFGAAASHFASYLEKPMVAGEANETNGRYNLGYSLLRAGQYRDAAQQFEKIQQARFATGNQPLDVMLRLADCYYMQKDFGRAGSLYTKVIGQRSYGADYGLMQTAMIAGAQQRTAEKITTLRSLETLYPQSGLVPAANMEIANTYLADEKFKDALPYLNKVMQAKSNASLKPEAYLKAGLAHYNLGSNDEALKTFKALVKQYPQSEESEEAIDNIRSIYVEQGKADAYVGYLKEMGRSIDNSTADSLTFTSAELLWTDGKKTEARSSLLNYLKQYPNGRYVVEANYMVAENLREARQTNEAMNYYGLVAKLAPNKYAERSLLLLARHAYFETKDYTQATTWYQQLKQFAANADNRLEAMRGLVRCQNQTGDYDAAADNARELLKQGGAGSDDKSFANIVLGKQAHKAGNYNEAIGFYKQVSNLNKAELGAEARFETARCYYQMTKWNDAEDAAFDVIKKSGSYELWVTRSYILLGDIYLAQKDYFNAKATYKSVSENAGMEALRKEAATKLQEAEAQEAAASKLGGN